MGTYSIYKLGVVLLLILAGTTSLLAQTSAPSKAMQEADTLFQAQKWTEAVAAYESVTKSDPQNGLAWLRMGSALHAVGQYDQAIVASKRAVDILQGPVAMYNLSRSYARIDNKEQAFVWLMKAINQGFFTSEKIRADEDLSILRDDPRFGEVLMLADKKTKPCMFAPQYKQFDFWVGEWEVYSTKGGTAAGISSIQRIVEGCIIYENWTGVSGVTGKSLNFYNKAKGRWQQTWIGSDGSALEYVGEYKEGAMRYEAVELQSNGAKLYLRLIFFNLGPDRVRQLSEQSTDGGKSWTPQYDLTYVRKK